MLKLKRFEMKKLAVILSLSVFSVAFAQPTIPITKSSDGELWVAHAPTFKILSDGFSMMVSKIATPDENKPDVRLFVGVTKKDCAQGYDVLLSRENETEPWTKQSNFIIEGSPTVGDEIATLLCGAGMKVLEESRKKSQNSA